MNKEHKPIGGMFVIPNINEQLKGISNKQLDIFDDSKIAFMLDEKYKKQWDQISKITIRNSYCTIKFIELLGGSHFASKIKELDLSMNYKNINDKFVDRMLSSPYLRNLQIIDFADSEVTDEGVYKICQSTNMQNLHTLNFYGCLDITNETINHIRDSKILTVFEDEEGNQRGIKKLDLRATLINDEGIQEIATSENFRALEYLDVSINEGSITDQSMTFIKASSILHRLKVLKVATCRITDKGVTELLHAGCISNLEELDISNDKDMQHFNNITDESLKMLASTSSCVENLKKINVRASFVTSSGWKTFLTSQNCQQLQEIRTTFCQGVDKQFLLDIVENRQKYCKSLKRVLVNDTGVQLEGIAHFVKECPDIELIYNYGDDITKLLENKKH